MNDQTKKPLLLITSGDPCGVGPEVILKSLYSLESLPVRISIIGDLKVFNAISSRMGFPVPNWHVVGADSNPFELSDNIVFIDILNKSRFVPGDASADSGQASMSYLDLAVRFLREGRAGGIVTAPVTKWTVQKTRGDFQGHTEYLAKAIGKSFVVMMFVSESLRVALLTRHAALKRVSSLVKPKLIYQTVTTVYDGLKCQFGITNPRIAVLGLNPHSGEEGSFGDEEKMVLEPAMRECKKRKIIIEGPFAPDGYFASGLCHDAVICWYHDQALIPFKLMARDSGCQISLGLGFVRTSPDHGSALDIAGKGIADPGSMIYSIKLAARLLNASRLKRSHSK